MTQFITGITDMLSGIFGALVNALGSIGNLIFVSGESGAITGLTGFGTLLTVAIGLPLATWVFGKLFTWIKGLVRAGGK